MDITNVLPASCRVVVPKAGDAVSTIVPRWSFGLLELPFAVATPTKAEDIISIIQ
jgi:hypothetical protein